MKVLIVLIAAFQLTIVTGQTLSRKQSTAITSTIELQFGKLNNLTNLELGRQVFCEVGADTFYNPIGFHFLFQLTGDSLIRLDSCVFHGGNFDRYLFSWNDRIYTMGGYGFFTTNNNLEYFNLQSHEWSFEPTTGDLPPFLNGFNVQQDHYIYSFNNLKGGNAATQDAVDSALYRLDLDSMIWKKYRNANDDIRTMVHGRPFYTRDYAFILNSPYSILIRENDLQFERITTEELGLAGWDDHFRIDQNILTCGVLGRGPDDRQELQLHLDSIWLKYENIAQQFIVEDEALEPDVADSSFVWYFMGGTLALLMTGVIIYRSRNKNSLPNNSNPVDESVFVQKLRKHPKRLLTVEELDELLEISHLESDSKKLKRHRILSELDAKYPGRVVREKDETDKRRFLYRIELSQVIESQS